MSNKIICEYCGKEISKYGIKNHISIIHMKIRKGPNKGKLTWNKGLTKETDERVKLLGKTISESTRGRVNHSQSEKTKQKLREHAIKNKLGGHTSKKSVRYKTIEGKEIYLQSSYEEKVAKSLDINKIKWIRPSYVIWEDSENIKHRYYPDFYLIDYDVYLDPKNNYLINKDKKKIQSVCEQNNIKVIVLTEFELEWDEIYKMLI